MMRAGLLIIASMPLMLATPGGAAVVFELPASSGPLLSPGAVAVDFKALKGSGLADFRIQGYASLDGAGNGYTDVFTLSHNGIDIYSGAFNLGGGGRNLEYLAPTGSSFTASSPGGWRGGIADFSVPITFSTGVNNLVFRYAGKAQGVRDESWSLDKLRVTGATGAVPEPASWAMMIIGFGAIGTMLRARRSPQGIVSS